ncbi:MAG: quinol:cytochrome C oxidoreductase [Myxococcota bacterium]
MGHHRLRAIPPDVKTRFEGSSPWRKYPFIFWGVGVVCLMAAFAFGQGGAEEHASIGFESVALADHHDDGEAHGHEAHHGGDAHDGDKAHHDHDGHGAKGAHGSGGGHGDEDHGDDGGHGHHHGELTRFSFSYLTAFMYGLSLALGGLFFVLVQFLARAGWSVVVRRIAENVMATLPLFGLLFIPVYLGLSSTHFHWWHFEGHDPLLDHKAPYLDENFFILRAIFYIVVWVGLAFFFWRNSTAQDNSGEHDLTRRMQNLSPLGMILFALTTTFAAVDWMKSMDPHWFSTMFGVYYFAGCVVGIFATLSVLTIWLQSSGYVKTIINAEHYHDIGKLLFGFVVFWTYITFSQYFLIWYANIPEETLWYYHRTTHGWENVGVAIMIGHFFIPFFFLLPRGIKRNPKTLILGALWLLGIHYLDLYYVVMPILDESPHFTIVDPLCLVGIVCLFLGTFAFVAGRSDLVPVKDPRLPESLAFQNL